MLPAELHGEPDARAQARAAAGAGGPGGPRRATIRASCRAASSSGWPSRRAFASRPNVLFADEPTGNLDTATGARIIDLLFELNETFSTTLVLVTHDERLAQPLSAGGHPRRRQDPPVKPSLALRLAWRDWRSGELGLLLAALLVAVGSVTAVSLLVDRLQQALVLRVRRVPRPPTATSAAAAPIPDAFRVRARGAGAGDGGHAVVSVHGVRRRRAQSAGGGEGGVAGLSAARHADRRRPAVRSRGRPTGDLPRPGQVWLDSRLFPALGVTIGDTVEVGLREAAR